MFGLSNDIYDRMLYSTIKDSLDSNSINLLYKIVESNVMHYSQGLDTLNNKSLNKSLFKLKKLKLIESYDDLKVYLATSMGKQFLNYIQQL